MFDCLQFANPNTPIGRRFLQIAKIQRQVMPQKAPNILTSVTTFGTIRRPLPQFIPKGGPGANVQVQVLYFVAINDPPPGGKATTLKCNTGPSNSGQTVLVVKPPKLSHAIQAEGIEGDTISYTYQTRTNNLDGQRTAQSALTGIQQIEIILPVYLVGDLIHAITIPANPLGNLPSQVIDMNVDARAWCQI